MRQGLVRRDAHLLGELLPQFVDQALDVAAGAEQQFAERIGPPRVRREEHLAAASAAEARERALVARPHGNRFRFA